MDNFNKNHYYTGIGSRETPILVQKVFTRCSKFLYRKGYILRSGGAKGSDSAFEKGAYELKNIYLPYRNYNNNKSKLYFSQPFNTNLPAFKMAEKFHPNWYRMDNDFKKALQARNCFQVLGQELNDPSDFLICYTKNGMEIGGTSQAIRIAKEYNIPIFNAGIYVCKNKIQVDDMEKELKQFLKELIYKN